MKNFKWVKLFILLPTTSVCSKFQQMIQSANSKFWFKPQIWTRQVKDLIFQFLSVSTFSPHIFITGHNRVYIRVMPSDYEVHLIFSRNSFHAFQHNFWHVWFHQIRDMLACFDVHLENWEILWWRKIGFQSLWVSCKSDSDWIWSFRELLIKDQLQQISTFWVHIEVQHSFSV